METLIKKRIKEAIDNLNKLCLDKATTKLIFAAANLIVESIQSGNKLMICGNGGSAANTQHMAGEFVCRYYKDRDPLRSVGKIKAVFIDRDGTINADKGYVFRIEDFELLPGSLEALKLLTRNNIKIYIITNQAGIAKGYYTEEDFHMLTDSIINRFQQEGIIIEKVLYCPHHPEGIVPEYTRNCNCRKPNTKLFEDVIQQNGYQKSELILIGDKDSDIEAGNKLGIITYLVQTGYGREHQTNTKATYIQQDLLSVVKHIISATS